MLTFANFESIFTKAAKPCWTLYKGASKGTQIGSFYPDVEEGDPDMTDSLVRLKELVETYGDGVYTVECKSRRTTSKGNDLHTFLHGEMPGKVADKVGNVIQTAHPAASFFSGLDGRYFMDQIATLQREVQALQMQLWQKDMEIQRVKWESKTKKEVVSGTDRFMSILEANPALLEKGIGLLSGQPVAIGTLKATKPIPPAAPVGQVADEDDEGEDFEYAPGNIDLNAMVLSAGIIQKSLPEQHVNDLLDRLADFIEANPDQARNLLNMMV